MKRIASQVKKSPSPFGCMLRSFCKPFSLKRRWTGMKATAGYYIRKFLVTDSPVKHHFEDSGEFHLGHRVPRIALGGNRKRCARGRSRMEAAPIDSLRIA